MPLPPQTHVQTPSVHLLPQHWVSSVHVAPVFMQHLPDNEQPMGASAAPQQLPSNAQPAALSAMHLHVER